MKRAPAKTLAQIEAGLDDAPVDKREAPKELVVERLPDGMYSVKWTAGGELPDVLKGRWTNLARASIAIDNFLNAKEA